MNPPDASLLDRLVDTVLEGSRYRTVCPDFVRHVGSRELTGKRSLKEVVKATRNRLHQVAGAYLDARFPYSRWLDALAEAAQSEDPSRSRDARLEIMRHHASTRERLESLDEFYGVLFGGLPPVHSLLDVACGLNPLALPWMPGFQEITYHACDLFTDMMQFLNDSFALTGTVGTAFACDVTVRPPDACVDVALVLKALPPLERIDRSAPQRLLEGLRARHIIVSYPTRTLGGRDKSMAVHYEARFRTLVPETDWEVERFEFANELCFRICRKNPPPSEHH